MAATLSKASGLVNCNYVTIVNSTATGGATFLARHATDGGGNSGWIFAEAIGVATGSGAGAGSATGTRVVSGVATGSGTGAGSATGARTVFGVASGAGTGGGSATGTTPGVRRSNFGVFRRRPFYPGPPEVPFDVVARWARRG